MDFVITSGVLFTDSSVLGFSEKKVSRVIVTKNSVKN